MAVAHHGDRLEIVQRRRRFLKVRTALGQEGWIDERQLLNAEEMSRLKRLAQTAKAMPSQGAASAYDTLTVHTDPSRQAPGFVVIRPGEKVEVVGHEVAPRTAPARKPLVPSRRKSAKQKKPGRVPKLPPPPAPRAPGPPPDWLDLSKTDIPPDPDKTDNEPEPRDDWSLIRTSSGESGWVLTRRLYMAIPDDVAQYAEGRRITSYFALGDEVHDRDQVKRNWLWTTIRESIQPYDFDSFRVFIWSLRRHRYETAYIQRNLKGYFPVLADKSGFSVCVENREGQRVRRSYVFLGSIVRPAGERACTDTINR